MFLWNNNYDRNVIGSKSCRRGDEFLRELKVNLKSSKRTKFQHGDTSIFELTATECWLKHLNFVSDTFQLTFIVATILSFHLWFIWQTRQGEWLSRITNKTRVFQIKKDNSLSLLYYIFFIQYNLKAVWFLLYRDFLRTTLQRYFHKNIGFPF